jgi:hypothetical protein
MRVGMGRIGMGWIASLAVSACGGGSTGARHAEVARPNDACASAPATLRFAWPADLRAHVVGRDLTESRNQDGSAPRRGESASDLRLRVDASGDERWVGFEIAREGRFRTTGFAPEVGGRRPRVLLGASGTVMGVDGVDGMRTVLEGAMARGEIDAEQGAAVAHNVTDAVQLGTARAHWDWVVGVWNGRTLRCGEPQRVHAEIPALSFGSAEAVRFDVELELLGDADCGGVPSQPGARCVHLRASQHAGPSAMVPSLRFAEAQMGAGARIVHAQTERHVDVVTEVGSLVPHEVAFEERASLTWRVAGRPDSTRLIRDLQTYRFDYDPEASRARTDIMVDPTTGGFAVLRDGRPVQLPDTPTCRALVRCCEALGPTGGMMCGLAIASFDANDCDEELGMVAVVAETDAQRAACTP